MNAFAPPTYPCHRCQSPLEDGVRFCPVCGAPQLTVEVPEVEKQPGGHPSGGPGATPAHEHGSDEGWAAAVGIAGKLGVPAGVLSSVLSFGSVWVLAGSMYATVLLAQRLRMRVPRTLGVRMGAVLGLFAAVIATAADAIKLLLTRYVLHRGGEIDAEIHGAIQAVVDRALANNPSAMSEVPGLFHFVLSPNGEASLLVLSALFSGLGMVLLAALGGALGARYLRPRQG